MILNFFIGFDVWFGWRTATGGTSARSAPPSKLSNMHIVVTGRRRTSWLAGRSWLPCLTSHFGPRDLTRCGEPTSCCWYCWCTVRCSSCIRRTCSGWCRAPATCDQRRSRSNRPGPTQPGEGNAGCGSPTCRSDTRSPCRNQCSREDLRCCPPSLRMP